MAEGSNILSVEKQVQQLLALERQPVFKMQARKGDVEVKNAVFSDLSSKLSKLRASAQSLSDLVSSVFNSKSTTTSDKDVLTATASSGASAANHTITVNSLAKAHAVTSGGFISTEESFSTGTFTITTADGTSKSISVTVTPGEDNSTVLTNIASAINSSGLQVGASVITTDAGSGTKKLVLTSDDTGAAGMMVNIADTSGTLASALNIDGDVGIDSTSFVGTADDFADQAYTFRVTMGDASTVDISVTVASGDSNSAILGKIAAAVNSDATLGAKVNASVVTDGTTSTNRRVVFSSEQTGADNLISGITDITGTLASDLGITGTATVDKATQLAQDASLTVDGNSVTSSSNTNSSVLTGVTLNMLGTSASAVEVNITVNVEEVTTKIKAFLEEYNEVIKFVKDKTGIDPATHQRAALSGDTIISGISGKLRDIMTTKIEGHTKSGNPNYLSEIGITAANDGTLSITSLSTFEDALKSDPDQVADLFFDPDFNDETATFVAGVPTSGGFANKIDELLESFVKSGGIISGSKKVLDSQITDINRQISDFEDRLKIREEVLRNQFSALFEVLARLSVQQQAVSRFTAF